MFNLRIVGFTWVRMHHIPEDEGCLNSTAKKGEKLVAFCEIRTNSVFRAVLNLSAHCEEVALTCSSLTSLLVWWPRRRLVGGTLGSFIVAVRWIHCWAIFCCSVRVGGVVGVVLYNSCLHIPHQLVNVVILSLSGTSLEEVHFPSNLR